MASDRLDSRAYRAARKVVLAGHPPCCRCGLPINYDAQPKTTWAPSVEHLQARSKGGDVTDPANLAAAHFGCNSKRGNRDVPPSRRSRPW